MKEKKKYTLLIIDGDPMLHILAEKKLSSAGYKVLTTNTGEKGIKATLKYSPDLILLDYELPDMTGSDVCRYLRNSTISAKQPILFITGKNDYQSIQSAYQSGATDFCSKPMNWELLSYRIQYILRNYEIDLAHISSENKLNNAQKVAKIANWDYNPIDQQFSWSDTIFSILETPSKQAPPFNLEKILEKIPEQEVEYVKGALEGCINNRQDFELEHSLITETGELKTISHLGCVIKSSNRQVIDYIGTIQDITERCQSEDKIRDLAYYDSLTGLMNRETFLSALDETLITNKRHNLLSALLFIDLDDFKRINDTLGHDMGDLLLCEVSSRLQECVRTVEKEFNPEENRKISSLLKDKVFRIKNINRFDIGRLGGDEFTVFLSDIPSKEVAGKIAARLLTSLETPFHLAQHEISISFSIGIAISPLDGDNIKCLLKNADTAMYSAKTHGKNNYQFYQQAMNKQAIHMLQLEVGLRSAIKNNELSLVYQPQICLKTGAILGAEALMRWKHKTRGYISPSQFIPLAESSGEILNIGDWLFKEFSANLKHWKKQRLLTDSFKLSLNISALQFSRSNIINTIEHYFPDESLNTHVDFELTESVLMDHAETSLGTLNTLKPHKISLSIDDFGTGYSSLSYLHHFPIDSIKIDRSFIFDMQIKEKSEIIRTIIAMARSMNVSVIAEGVEQQWQADMLLQEGCVIGQGFFFYKPLSVTAFQQLLNSNSAKQ